MKIKKALITAAGFGTRLLPISKTIQKEMLPILNRPMIDYVVSDCVNAGIEEIIFVVKESQNKLVEHYYLESRSLKQHMEMLGKIDKYFKARVNISDKIKFRFIVQTTANKYGTTVPVEIAEKYLKNEDAFLVFMGDDFIYNKDVIETTAMIELYKKSQAEALVTCITKPQSELHKYGVAKIKNDNNYNYLINIVEKPKKGQEPSNLINISKYIFTPKIFQLLKNQEPNPKSGEYYITDTATQLAIDNRVVIYTPKGRYLDGGSVLNWLKANLVVAKDDPELNQGLREFLKEEF